MSAIEVSYNWSEKEYLEAADQDNLHGDGKFKGKLVTIVVGVLIVLSLFMMAQRGFVPADSMIFVLAVYWFVLRKRLHKNLLRRRYLKSDQKDKKINLSISDESINVQTEGRAGGSFDWTNVTKVVRTNAGSLVYAKIDSNSQSKSSLTASLKLGGVRLKVTEHQDHYSEGFIWLPNTAFVATDEVERFAALSERKAKLFVDKSAA